jgi:tetratricopeptide (TPR) repeat protein
MVRRGAPDGAATYLRRALAEPPGPAERPRLLLECGLAETLGDGQAAVAHLREVADDPHTDPVTFAEAAYVLTHTLLFAGTEGESTVFARDAAARLAPQFVDQRQALAALERASAYMDAGDPGVWAGQPPPPVTGDGLGARMLATERAWELCVGGQSRQDAVEWARFGLADGRLVREDPGLFWVIGALVIDLTDEDPRPFWDDALTVAHTRGSLFSVMSVHLWRGFHQWRRGDLPEAYQLLSLATEQGARWAGGLPNFAATYGLAFQVGVLIDRGDLAAARRFVDDRRTGLRLGEGARLFDEAHAQLLLAERRFDDALDLLDKRAARITRPANPMWPYFQGRALRARALAGLGRYSQAQDAAEQVLTDAREWGVPSAVGYALRLVGELRQARPGPGGDGVAELREAVALLGTTACRVENLRALVALADAIAHDSPERLDLLRQALRLAEQCGATGLRDAVRERLVRAGITVPAEPDTALTLTTTERAIAAMAAGGADEREIAQALFLTPRSVRDVLDRIAGSPA